MIKTNWLDFEIRIQRSRSQATFTKMHFSGGGTLINGLPSLVYDVDVVSSLL